MDYRRLPIEIESPEERGYDSIRCNLTESSVTDATLEDYGVELSGLTLAYGDHRGLPELRDAIAADSGATAGDVLCAPGAAAALFFVASSVLRAGDHAVIEHTNYSTNLETPRLIGAHVDPIRLRIEDGYRLDIERVAAMIRPDTRLISVTTPHNPTGVDLSLDDLHALVELAERHGCWLLVDETYREMARPAPLPVAASLSPRAISVSSMSKTYGLPGLRLGWIVNRDPELSETLLAAKEQIVICGSTLDETASAQVLARRDEHLPRLRAEIDRRVGIVTDWLAEQSHWLEWVEPTGGVVCFPRVRAEVVADMDRFYEVLHDEHGTFVGEGHWFDTDRHHFRLGFGWPPLEELQEGLRALAATADLLR
ncbi:MAG: pyridoxal phosphate-dependent aminotransferase [Actinomycetota bacterium]|nr:pyridoxal phosphate-dependent aminotransferase [Actinomycetota bacterium]